MARGGGVVERFLRDVLDPTSSGAEKPLSQITLSHATVLPNSGHTHLKEIHTIRRLADDQKPWDVEVIAKMFRTKAELYCAEMSSEEKFVLTAMFGKDDAPRDQPFSINSNRDYNSLQSYPANKEGSQQMGHDLLMVMARGFFAGQQALLDKMQGYMDRQDNALTHAQNENREMFALLRESAMREIQMKNDQEMKILEYRRSSEERKMILKLAPALINTLLGREVFPQNVEDTALIETIATQIPEDQIKMIQQFMPAPISGLLFDRFMRAIKEEKAAEELARRTAKMLPEGEGGLH